MKGFLRRLLFGPEGQSIQHAVLGKSILIDTKTGPYWEAEPKLGDRTISVAIETRAGEPPSALQIDFYFAVVRDLDAAFSRAAPLLVPEFEKWMRQPFPSQWTAAFEFVGLSVPIAGDSKNPWELQFECVPDKNRHLFTCYFREDRPERVSIDG